MPQGRRPDKQFSLPWKVFFTDLHDLCDSVLSRLKASAPFVPVRNVYAGSRNYYIMSWDDTKSPTWDVDSTYWHKIQVSIPFRGHLFELPPDVERHTATCALVHFRRNAKMLIVAPSWIQLRWSTRFLWPSCRNCLKRNNMKQQDKETERRLTRNGGSPLTQSMNAQQLKHSPMPERYTVATSKWCCNNVHLCIVTGRSFNVGRRKSYCWTDLVFSREWSGWSDSASPPE